MKKIHLLLLGLMIGTLGQGQTILASQDFDTETSWGYTAYPEAYNIENLDIWGLIADIKGVLPQKGASYWGIRDLNNPWIEEPVPAGLGLTNPLDHTLTFDNVSVAGNTEVAISFWYSASSFETTAYIRAEFFFDDVSQGVESVFSGELDGRETGQWLEYVKQVPDGTSQVRVTIITYNDQDYAGVDNFQVVGGRVVIEPCPLVVGSTTAQCDTVTDGADSYTAAIAFTGGGTDTYLVTASRGVVGGDDPGTIAEGTILITGVEEDSLLTVTVTGSLCDETITIPSPNCVPATALPFEDAFDYPAGESLVSASSFWSTSGADDEVLIHAGNLSYAGLKASAGNSVSLDGAGNEAVLNFVPVQSGTVYASFIFKVTDMNPGVFIKGGYFAVLGDYSARLYIQPDTVDASKFEIGIGQTNKVDDVTFGGEKYATNDEIFLVMSYDLSTNNADVWVNPSGSDLEANEAPAPTLTMYGGGATEIGMFIIRQDSPSETPFIVMDELRVASSWAGATPRAVVSTGKYEAGRLSLYPNPVVSGQFTIQSERDASMILEVYDLSGRKVYSGKHQSNQRVDVSHLETGYYLLRIDEKGAVSVERFIIE